MKQKLKRALLVLCMVASFFTLSACSSAADTNEAETVDAQTSAYLCQVNESLLQQIVSFDEETAVTAQEQLNNRVISSGIIHYVYPGSKSASQSSLFLFI